MYLTKLGFLLPIVILAFGTLKGENEVPRITEIQLTRGDSLFRRLYIYNEDGQKSVETKYVKSGHTWLRHEQTEWFYFNGLCVEQHLRVWRNSQWQPAYRITYEHSDSGVQSEILYDATSGQEIDLQRTDYDYADTRLLRKTISRKQNGQWQTAFKSEQLYAEEQNQIQQMLLQSYDDTQPQQTKIAFSYTHTGAIDSILCQVKSGDTWLNSQLTIYHYHSMSGSLVAEIVKQWNPSSDTWINVQCTEYDYDEDGRVQTEFFLKWNGAYWQKNLKHSYTYTPEGLLLKKTIYLPIYNHFRPAWSINYSDFKYANAGLIEAKNEFWGGQSGTPFNTFIPYLFNGEQTVEYANRIIIGYMPANTDLSNVHSASEESRYVISVYPNPSEGIFYFDSEKYNVNRWTVSDLSGKIILHGQNGRSGIIDLSDFNTGIYLFRAETPDGIKVQRLVKR